MQNPFEPFTPAARCITGMLTPQMADAAVNPRKTMGQIIGCPVEFYSGLKGAKRRERVNDLLGQTELEPS